MLDAFEVFGRVERFDPDALRGSPVEAFDGLVLQLRFRQTRPVVQRFSGKSAVLCHGALPRPARTIWAPPLARPLKRSGASCAGRRPPRSAAARRQPDAPQRAGSALPG